jgi:hypothetical protein
MPYISTLSIQRGHLKLCSSVYFPLLPAYTISHYKLSFWAAASALWALAAAVRARPPAGRARPSPLHIKKALASKWYNYTPPASPFAS